MNIFFVCLFVGVSLSMDAFSLALGYGTCGLSLEKQIFLSCMVGVFHFFMPLIGFYFGNMLMRYFFIYYYLIVGGILGLIGISMVISVKRDDDIRILDSMVSFILFAFTVSIDSFTMGFGLSAVTEYYYLACFIFMVISGSFTFWGLRLGYYLNYNFGKVATFFGGVFLVVMGVLYLN